MTGSVDLLQDPDRLRAALTPLRRRLLERLAAPASASELAEAMGVSRQKLNYHLRALEEAGLIRLVEERRKRGFSERVMIAAADRLVIDPAMLAPAADAGALTQDRFAAGHLVTTAGAIVRDVARMQAAADREGARLLTFTLEAEVALARPGDLEAFSDALAQALAEVGARFNRPGADARRYRVVVGGHPAPKAAASTVQH